MLAGVLQISCAFGVLRLVASRTELPTGSQNDAELVARALDGERAALGLLYRRHAPRIARRATRLLARTADAEDLVQDAFVEAFRDLSKLEEPARFSHWLMRIVTHQAQRRFRRRRLLQKLGLAGADDAGLGQLVDPCASPEVRLQCAQLDQALRRFADRQRIAWVLRYVEACSLPEIAEYQGCSLATVKRRLQAANAAILAYVDFELPDEPVAEAAVATESTNLTLAGGAQ